MRMKVFTLLAVLAVGLLSVGTARADVFTTAVTNNAAYGGGPIQTWVLNLTMGTAVSGGSFVPTGAMVGSANGRAIAVTNTQFYYTELSGGFGATPSIESGLFNGGAGSADNGSVANPTPGLGIQNLHFGGGGLYAVAGYPTSGPFVYVFNPNTGAIISGPPVALETDPGTDGFTIMNNGNYLLNRGDAYNSYDQYDPLTGARIAGTNFSVAGCGNATGVDTDGTFLFFNCNFNQIAQTDLTGSVVNIFTLPGTFGAAEGLSLISDFSPPPPPPAGVPEPASIALLGTVVALVGLKMRNKTAPPSQT